MRLSFRFSHSSLCVCVFERMYYNLEMSTKRTFMTKGITYPWPDPFGPICLTEFAFLF